MAIRKSDDLANESDSRYNNVKTAKAREKITERFDDTTHNEQPSDEALQFLNKKIDEVIDSVNTNISKTGISTSQASAITANTSKTGISTSQASAITANTAKVGTTSTERSRISANHAKVSYDKNLSNTDDIDLKATVTENRGTYTLVFTITAGRTTKTASISLE
jgi:hypothetical protein|tara:strand:+ start:982 stop:1476 length:495 start_codon:yes stop_codon:yes gene_type:complete